MRATKYMNFRNEHAPRGCQREIRKYKKCLGQKDKEACFPEKVGIMEVCPDHVLYGFREMKKWYKRAELIDNDTYRRAMSVSDYNRGRSVSDLELTVWEEGTADKLRSESTW